MSDRRKARASCRQERTHLRAYRSTARRWQCARSTAAIGDIHCRGTPRTGTYQNVDT